MSRRESAFVRLENTALDLIDDLTMMARADGVIDAREQNAIDRARFIVRELERGDIARPRSRAIENTWVLCDSPHTQRRIRETLHDLGGDAA